MWVSSHCGLVLNKQVDKVANEALRLPAKEFCQVEVHFQDSRKAIRGKQKPHCLKTPR